MAQPKPPTLRALPSLTLGADVTAAHDALIVVGTAPLAQHLGKLSAELAHAVEAAFAVDASLAKAHGPIVLPIAAAPGGRLVLAATSSLEGETDDVRAIGESAFAATTRATSAGAQRPLLAVFAPSSSTTSTQNHARLSRAVDVAALSALASQWVPLEVREAEKAPRTAQSITVLGIDDSRARRLSAIEAGRALARDIAGTEPERMSPLRVAELCEAAFSGTSVTVKVEHDVSGYPLLAAVARASQVVPRHRPCVIHLEHATPDAHGKITRTLVLVGKGVTYDTGGADLKTDGHMAGMSRDKGGAAAVAGVLKVAAELEVPGVRVVGLLGMVRNSIGEESFVSDEIIQSRGGVRVRIGNTDAEGRLVLSDLLSVAKEIATGAPDPLVISVATLTGHVYRAYGPYIGGIGNAASKPAMDRLDLLGELWGEPMERSRPRREDYSFILGKSGAEEILSCNRAASVNTPRGHQFPFAFLDVTAGLKGTGLPFIHLDIGGAACDPPDWQNGRPTASPVATLTAWLEGA